jgi:hypothetical protein
MQDPAWKRSRDPSATVWGGRFWRNAENLKSGGLRSWLGLAGRHRRVQEDRIRTNGTRYRRLFWEELPIFG